MLGMKNHFDISGSIEIREVDIAGVACILNSISWMNVILWKMSQCNTTFDLKINLGHSDLYFMVQWFFFVYFLFWKHFSFIGKAWCRRAMLSCNSSYYAPNFKEVEGAYWFGPVRGSVRASVTLAYGQERLEIGSWNLMCGISMKNKRTRIFFLFCWTFHCRVMPLFRRFFFTLPL